MNLENLKKFLTPPVAIYAVIFLFISALIGAKIDQKALWVWFATLLISVVGLYFATNYAKPKNWKEGLKYGIVWAVVFFALDLILTLPFVKNYFTDWRSYIPYVLSVGIPILLTFKNK